MTLFTRYQFSFLLLSGLFFLLYSTAPSALSLNKLPPAQTANNVSVQKSFAALKKQRKLFLRAERLLKLGRYTQYKRIQPWLLDYPLYPYLRFIELNRGLKKASNEEIQQFLQIYHSTPLANKLYYRWIKSLARKRKSKTLIRYFRPTQNKLLLCHYADALHETGEHRDAFSLMGEIWQTGNMLPKSCDRMLYKWRNAGYMTNERIWFRIHLVMKKGKRRLASYLAKLLDKEDQQLLKLWKKIQRHPEHVLDMPIDPKSEKADIKHWILVDGMSRLSRRQPLIAANYWQTISSKQQFTSAEKERIERHLALALGRAATPLSRATLIKLQLIPQAQNISPHILSAIADNDWPAALAWLNNLSASERSSERWRYWRARTLEEMGRLDEARSLYVQVSENRSYYSFLSADRIGRRYQMTHRAITTPATEFLKLQHIPAIARASELYQLKRIVNARREWHFAIQSMEKSQLRMAAQLANKWGWHDRSIVTLALAKHWDDLEMRFPLAHQKHIERQAKREKINPAWAFAVIRQESGFTVDARSSAGALGLMQLMPRTARQVARSLRLKRPRQTDLLKSNVNIKLGVRYLRKLSRHFKGSTVLATAAYNAGQWRVKGWLPKEEAQSADLWIENIPFTETRKYIKRVLTYTVIYEQRLGLQGKSLLERMVPVLTRNKKI